MKRLLLIAAAAMYALQAPAAQTTATARAREVVAMINGATPGVVKDFVDSTFAGPMRERPPEVYVNLFLALRERSGQLEWVSVQEESATRAVVLLTRTLTGETNALQLSIEEAPPHRVTRLDLRVPPGATPRLASDAELAGAVERYVSALAGVDAFSGSVLLARDGQVLYSGRSGAPTRTSTPRTPSRRSSTSVR